MEVGLAHGVSYAVIYFLMLLSGILFEVFLRRVEGLFVLRDGG